MEKPLLKDPDTFPDENVLKGVLKSSYPVYQTFMTTVTGEPFDLEPHWRFYKDGGAWLCKVAFKKKTIFWLSIWDGFFKTTFYFTEKNGAGIAELNVDQKLKDIFNTGKWIGKLKPLTVNIEHADQINDVLKIVDYKKCTK
jgi:hypothetical protein